ncbi:MAG: hypothetical protein NDI81_08320 [Desulfobacula sp.]|nr:hypothetical protein [Desulfobacula sp.]
MNIMGLHVTGSQTSAILLRDGDIICGAAEERFDRIKQSRAFPRKAIQYCLSKAGLKTVDELDAVAVSWNPAINMANINLSGFTQWRRYDPEWLYIVPNNLMGLSNCREANCDMLSMLFPGGPLCPVYYVAHHRAHLAHAVYQSPFEKCLAVSIDEYGELASVTVAHFSNGRFTILKEIPYPNSLGVFFAAITEYLGFTPNSDEWKVMGAAAYGDPGRYRSQIEDLLAWDEAKGEWQLDTRLIEHSNMKRGGYLNDMLTSKIGIPVRTADDDLLQQHYDLAASAQAVFEQRLFQLVSHYATAAGETNLAASGGCFMNSLANGKLIANTPVTKLFIPYAAADNGGAMGAALHVWHNHYHHPHLRCAVPPSPYLGPDYSDEEIEATLKRFGLTFRKVEEPERFCAEQLAVGKLVGWFQGCMEYGERALGNRSILADPRDPSMKEKINAAVKYREAFRPFAPSILFERVLEYFDIPEGVEVPYMEQVYPIRPEVRDRIPAVVHVDGTGRLQTVHPDINPLFHGLISEFEKITGIPLILNTSFNIQGEPVVCSPADAVRTFYTCGLNTLIISKYCIVKDKIC